MSTGSYISQEELTRHQQRVQSLASQFLAASHGRDLDRIEALSDEIEPLYGTTKNYYDQCQSTDPAYAGVAGIHAYVMAIYYIEYRYVPDEANQYSLDGMRYLQDYMDYMKREHPGDNTDSIQSMYRTVAEYAAYLAFQSENYDMVYIMIENLPASYVGLGLCASALTYMASEKEDPRLAQNALNVFDQMDSSLNAPARNNFEEDVYRTAYTLYALLMAKGPDHYPGQGFVRDIPRAVACLRKAQGLLHDEQYIGYLQDDIDEYMAMM